MTERPEEGDEMQETIPNDSHLIVGAEGNFLDEGSYEGGLELEEEDLLSGLCPEDLNFSLNTSHCPQTIPGDFGSEDGGMELRQDVGHIPEPVFEAPTGEERREEEERERGENTFFGLPPLVQSLLKEHRGITQLYGRSESQIMYADSTNLSSLVCRIIFAEYFCNSDKKNF